MNEYLCQKQKINGLEQTIVHIVILWYNIKVYTEFDKEIYSVKAFIFRMLLNILVGFLVGTIVWVILETYPNVLFTISALITLIFILFVKGENKKK